jgi:ribonuclease P protein component
VISSPVARESFSRDDRLRKRREFQECYASGARVSGRYLQLFLIGRPAAGQSRLGLSVPKRVGTAVERNRLRRVLREIFRQNREALTTCCDLVLNVRPSARQAPFSDLLSDYLSTLARAARVRLPK